MITTAAAVSHRLRAGHIAVRRAADPADPRSPVMPDRQHPTTGSGQLPQPPPHRDHRPRFTRAASTAARPTAPARPAPTAPGTPAGPVGLNRIECRGTHSGHRNVAPHTGHHRCFNRNVKKPTHNPPSAANTTPTKVNTLDPPHHAGAAVANRRAPDRLSCPVADRNDTQLGDHR